MMTIVSATPPRSQQLPCARAHAIPTFVSIPASVPVAQSLKRSMHSKLVNCCGMCAHYVPLIVPRLLLIPCPYPTVPRPPSRRALVVAESARRAVLAAPGAPVEGARLTHVVVLRHELHRDGAPRHAPVPAVRRVRASCLPSRRRSCSGGSRWQAPRAAPCTRTRGRPKIVCFLNSL